MAQTVFLKAVTDVSSSTICRWQSSTPEARRSACSEEPGQLTCASTTGSLRVVFWSSTAEPFQMTGYPSGLKEMLATPARGGRCREHQCAWSEQHSPRSRPYQPDVTISAVSPSKFTTGCRERCVL